MKKLIVLAALLTASSSMATNNACLTKSEARAKWPKDHLYWHGQDHCWDNKQRSHYPRRKYEDPVMPSPVRRSMAQAEKPKVKFVNSNEYNEIDAMADQPHPPPMPMDFPTVDMLRNGWPWLVDMDVVQEFGPWERRVNGQ
jgi:hypothetical protein